jgi:transglutaminase-like putative cysteine protease
VIYRVRHVTRYDYQTPVDLGAHLAHLRPRPLPYQKVLRAGVHAAPAVSWRRDGSDHFGNEVTWLFLDVAHAAFQVIADATVDVGFPAPPDAAATPPWETVARQAREAGAAAWQAAEFAFDSPRAPADAGARDYAAPCFAPGRTVLEAVLDLNACIRRDFTFRAGVTTTSTPIAEVLRRREGVCQDFTHLMISALRGFGVPARYVSGYVRTRPSRGGAARLGADQSHAWVGAWLGPEHGWLDLDPTNGIVVRDEHVVLGWGRDFGDVTPLRGVILGGGEQTLSVEVELQEVAEQR